MRVAVLILTLLVGSLLYLDVFSAVIVGGLSDDPNALFGGNTGLLIAVLWLTAGAAVIGAPIFAAVAFVIAGLLGLAGGLGSRYADLTVWGMASFILAVLSLIGYLTKRRSEHRAERQQLERDERLAASIRQSIAAERQETTP